MKPELIVWDFDGVLNRNIVDGRFVWADGLAGDLGIDPEAFGGFLFRSGLMKSVVRGEVDLKDVLADWLAENGYGVTAETLLGYWFENDALPDPKMVALLQQLPCRHVIGTNNERYRAVYIEDEMGFGKRVERVFASGRMGVAKPDQVFFEEIVAWSGVAPGDILLIDDHRPNIDAARALGWQGFHFTGGRRDALRAFLGVQESRA